MNNNVRSTLLALMLVSISASAQMEATSYLMSSLPQYVNSNPAFRPKYKVAIGLPVLSSFQVDYSNNGFTYNDLVKKENEKLVADLSNWAKNLPDKSYITTSVQTDLFRLGIAINSKLYVTYNSALKVHSRMLLPKEMASLLVNGTSPYIGQKISMSPELQMTSYLEHAAGLSYELMDGLVVGGRLKLLRGLVGASTEKSSFGIAVADNYQITATGDFKMKTSGLYNFTQNDFQFSEERANYAQNNGWGIDLGASYELMDKLTVAASLVDIGRINWKNNVYEYTLSNASYTFSGIKVDELLNGNSSYAESQLDSLASEFEFKETKGARYGAPIPGKMYLSASYEVVRNFTVGTLLFSEIYQGRFASGWAAMLNKHFGRVVSTSLSYSISNRSFNNLGAGISLNLAPIQIYLVGDNLLRMPLSLAANQNLNSFINNTQVFNLRAGLNIVWGWNKEANAGYNKSKNKQSKSSSQIRARQKKRS